MKISKNIWLLPFLFITVHILYIGCCKCVTDLKGKPYRQITYVKANEHGESSRFSRDTVYVKDSLTSGLNIGYEFIARTDDNPFKYFVGTANALSCNCIYIKDSGYKYRLDSVGVFSNNTFASMPAGVNLISLFTGTLYRPGNSDIQYDLPINSLLDSLNFYSDYNAVYLKLKNSNPGIKTHTFRYILYSKGRAIVATNSKLLFWE